MLFKTESYELSQFSITMEAAFGKELANMRMIITTIMMSARMYLMHGNY